MSVSKLLRFLGDLYCRFEDDDVSALGAQITYYLILSFFPFLIFLMTVVGYLPLTSDEVLTSLSEYLPTNTYQIIEDLITQIMNDRNDTLLSVGVLATLWAASGGTTALIKGLNKAYDEAENRPWWKLKLLAISTTLVLAAVLLMTVGLLIFGHMIGKALFQQLHSAANFAWAWGVAKNTISLGVLIGVFTLMYAFMPNRRLTFRSVWPGAVFASLGWVAVSLAFSFYVNHFNNYTRTYGSIGAIIVLLIWLYLSSMIILVGGEINATLTFNREGRRKPACKSFSSRLMFWKKQKE